MITKKINNNKLHNLQLNYLHNYERKLFHHTTSTKFQHSNCLITTSKAVKDYQKCPSGPRMIKAIAITFDTQFSDEISNGSIKLGNKIEEDRIGCLLTRSSSISQIKERIVFSIPVSNCFLQNWTFSLDGRHNETNHVGLQAVISLLLLGEL